jgi:hypothetical protein
MWKRRHPRMTLAVLMFPAFCFLIDYSSVSFVILFCGERVLMYTVYTYRKHVTWSLSTVVWRHCLGGVCLPSRCLETGCIIPLFYCYVRVLHSNGCSCGLTFLAWSKYATVFLRPSTQQFLIKIYKYWLFTLKSENLKTWHVSNLIGSSSGALFVLRYWTYF